MNTAIPRNRGNEATWNGSFVPVLQLFRELLEVQVCFLHVGAHPLQVRAHLVSLLDILHQPIEVRLRPFPRAPLVQLIERVPDLPSGLSVVSKVHGLPELPHVFAEAAQNRVAVVSSRERIRTQVR